MISKEYLSNMPYTCKIYLNSFEKINFYINVAEQNQGEVYLMCNEKIVNGRSLMGIFTLDLCRPVWLFSAMPMEHQIKKLLLSNEQQMVS